MPDPDVGFDVDGVIVRGVAVHRDQGAGYVDVPVPVERQAGPLRPPSHRAGEPLTVI